MKTRGSTGGSGHGGIKCMESQWAQGVIRWGQGGQGPSRSRKKQSLVVVTVMGAVLSLAPPPRVCPSAYLGGRYVHRCET